MAVAKVGRPILFGVPVVYRIEEIPVNVDWHKIRFRAGKPATITFRIGDVLTQYYLERSADYTYRPTFDIPVRRNQTRRRK